jgi:pyruvate kinase
VGVLADLAGPKIRLAALPQDPLECRLGEELRIVRGECGGAGELCSNYEPLVDELSVGDRVLLADGTVGLEVIEKEADAVRCRVTGPGIVRARQGINLPDVALSAPSMTEADRTNAIWAAESGIDFVGLSFVRSPDAVHELRALLRERGSPALVIAKIEKPEALARLDEIVSASGAVMVARGDLGVEVDVADIAVVQKQIIRACRRHHKPVIVATQMLDSMQHSGRPTRAEVSDVANAILDGADACMLSGETAVGEFPRETVRMMRRIMVSTERLLAEGLPYEEGTGVGGVLPITKAVVEGASEIARRLDARLVVIATGSGATARVRAHRRDPIPTIGVSQREGTLRRMCLLWGVTPVAGAPVADRAKLRAFVDAWGREQGILHDGDTVVFVTGSEVVRHAHNLVVVYEVGAEGAD